MIYDKLVGIISYDTINFIKSTKSKKRIFKKKYQNKNGIFFEYIFNLKRQIRPKLEYKFSISGECDNEYNIIELYLSIDPNSEPTIYSLILGYIQDTIRHEIEHLTQDGENKLPFRVSLTKNKSKKIKIPSNYFLLKEEIPAMVNGMYRHAKYRKCFLNEIFEEYVGYWYKQNIFTLQQYHKILKTYINYAKKTLPKAKLK